MTQTNLSTKWHHGHRKQACGCQGEGVGGEMRGSLGLAGVSFYI